MINDIARVSLEISRLCIEREAQMKYYEIRISNLRAQLQILKNKINEDPTADEDEFPPILGIS